MREGRQEGGRDGGKPGQPPSRRAAGRSGSNFTSPLISPPPPPPPRESPSPQRAALSCPPARLPAPVSPPPHYRYFVFSNLTAGRESTHPLPGHPPRRPTVLPDRSCPAARPPLGSAPAGRLPPAPSATEGGTAAPGAARGGPCYLSVPLRWERSRCFFRARCLLGAGMKGASPGCPPEDLRGSAPRRGAGGEGRVRRGAARHDSPTALRRPRLPLPWGQVPPAGTWGLAGPDPRSGVAEGSDWASGRTPRRDYARGRAAATAACAEKVRGGRRGGGSRPRASGVTGEVGTRARTWAARGGGRAVALGQPRGAR